jgi:hypothetical protein
VLTSPPMSRSSGKGRPVGHVVGIGGGLQSSFILLPSGAGRGALWQRFGSQNADGSRRLHVVEAAYLIDESRLEVAIDGPAAVDQGSDSRSGFASGHELLEAIVGPQPFDVRNFLSAYRSLLDTLARSDGGRAGNTGLSLKTLGRLQRVDGPAHTLHFVAKSKASTDLVETVISVATPDREVLLSSTTAVCVLPGSASLLNHASRPEWFLVAPWY